MHVQVSSIITSGGKKFKRKGETKVPKNGKKSAMRGKKTTNELSNPFKEGIQSPTALALPKRRERKEDCPLKRKDLFVYSIGHNFEGERLEGKGLERKNAKQKRGS